MQILLKTFWKLLISVLGMENEQTQKYQNFISAQNFPEDSKIPIRILYPKKYDKRTYHFAMEVAPRGGGGGSGVGVLQN